MTMVWPAQSPALYPIEHLWGCLKRRLAEHENLPNGIHELWERVQMEWDSIPVEECQKLIESMPRRRVQAVLKAKEAISSTNNIQIPFSIQSEKTLFMVLLF